MFNWVNTKRTILVQVAISFFILFSNSIYSQCSTFLSPTDTFHPRRTLLASVFSASTYSAFSIGLYHAWYKNGNLTSFHAFDDYGEWKHMDKLGHIYDAYFQTGLCHRGAKWCGINDRKSVWIATGISNLFQTTIEVFDAYNKEWGFSWYDIGANLVESTFYIAQDYMWNEQKMLIKFSSLPQNYSNQNNIIQDRAKKLYGHAIAEKMLKDYNAQTYWLSASPSSFFKDSKWPQFLNLSLGYGAGGMLGGYQNQWTDKDGNPIQIGDEFPRFNQYYLSLDLDLRKIKTKNRFLQSAFVVLNIFKIPSPTLEYNSLRQIKFHWFHF